MSRGVLKLSEFLDHISDAIEKIERFTAGMDESAFIANEMAHYAVIKALENIGEASRNIARHYPDFAAAHEEVGFSQAYEMRNMLAHGYFLIELRIVWKTTKIILPKFKEDVRALAAALNASDPPFGL
jgi:uncharacterized protein with HEPN domain